MLMRFAVMGNPIEQSLSPLIHEQFAMQTGRQLVYEKRLVEPGQFQAEVHAFFQNGGRGLNITMPFKEEAYALAGVRTARCEEAKAANTLWQIDGVIHADNTDGVGLLRDLSRHFNLSDRRVLLLGAGGAARGIIGSLFSVSIASLTVMNRSSARVRDLKHDFPKIKILSSFELERPFDLIINATGFVSPLQNVGLGSEDQVQLGKPFCYDLSYSLNHPTPFIQWAHEHHFNAVDGLGMLLEQAAESFLIWHGVLPAIEKLRLHPSPLKFWGC